MITFYDDFKWIMVSLCHWRHFKCFIFYLLRNPSSNNFIFRHLGYLFIYILKFLEVNNVTVLKLLFQVSSHHVLLIFEFIQGSLMVFIDKLDGTLYTLSRSLHVFINAERCGSLTLAHLFHQHLSLKKLFVGLVWSCNYQLNGINNRSWNIFPSVRF